MKRAIALASSGCRAATWKTLHHKSTQHEFSTSRIAWDASSSVAALLQTDETRENVEVQGWIRSIRKQKNKAFAAVSDGSSLEAVQAVLHPEAAGSLSTGTAVRLHGTWQESQGRGQSHELSVQHVNVLGENDAENNPLQPKYQTADFLRTIPHLRARIPINALLLRLRSQVIARLTSFFEVRGFVQTHPPIITSSDCEGAGEVFTVATSGKGAEAQPEQAVGLATQEGENPAAQQQQQQHFFRTPKYLTVSAQLHLEALAMAVNKVWTLSPTFRAERSDTPRHLSEFYMLEGEMCFVSDLGPVMDLIEAMLRVVAEDLLASKTGLELLAARQPSRPATAKEQASNNNPQNPDSASIDADVLQRRWIGLATASWPRITYDEAIRTLAQAQAEGQVEFAVSPSAQTGLQAEHERFLATHIGQGSPVFVTDYPRVQKPFYMAPSTPSNNPDDPTSASPSSSQSQTVACFDLLVPDVCELAGGSVREFRSRELLAAMRDKGMAGPHLDWYHDLRRFGSVPHAGFGLGFDRLLCYLSGTTSVRDVVAFPRWYGRCEC